MKNTDQFKEIKFDEINSGDKIYIDAAENFSKVLAVGREGEKSNSPIILLKIQYPDGTKGNLKRENNHRYFIKNK